MFDGDRKGATFTIAELSVEARDRRVEPVEPSFELWIAAFETETFVQPQSDRVAVLVEQSGDVTAAQTIAEEGQRDELDPSSN